MVEAPTIPIDPLKPDPLVLDKAAQLLTKGEIVAAPSDTVYGFLALPKNARARERLNALKKRPGPYIVLVSSWEEARCWTLNVSDSVWKRLEKVWPGPTTVILPAHPQMSGAEGEGIALRMPDFALLISLITAVGEPLFSTSANRKGEPPPIQAQEVPYHEDYGPALILDAGPSESRIPSVIVDLTEEKPRVIRKGRGNIGPLLDQNQTGF